MTPPQTPDEAADNTTSTTLFRALSDPTRREILRILRRGSLGAGAIAEQVSVTKATLSHHFRTLEGAGLVRSERRGTAIVYTLQTNLLEELAATLLHLAAPEPHAVPAPATQTRSRTKR